MAKCCGPKAFTKKLIVGNEEIPIRGLEPIMFMIFNQNLDDDKSILNALVIEIENLGNKVPSDRREEFEIALLKEYKLFKEQIKLKREKKQRRIIMNIKVLGPGCMNCVTLEKRTAEALQKLNIEASLEKVTDYSEILSYGLVRTPGLLIDNKIVVQGSVPSVEQIQEILSQQPN